MRSLVLITSEFPYSSGEPFLSNELPYLSQHFERIYIFSINGKEVDKPMRFIPENAACFPLGNTTSKSKYLKYMVAGLIKPDTDLRIREFNLKRVAASLYTRGRALSIADQIYDIIARNNLNVDNTVVYSFWFAYQAVAAWLLSKKLNNVGAKTFAVSRAHGYDLYWERATGGYLPYQDVSLKKLRWCFPCSEYGAEYLLKKYPWATEKIRISRLGTKDYGLNPYNGERTFVTCCNLEPLKRMKLFADAFCELAKEDKAIKWICIGSGKEEEDIRKIVNSAGVSNQVTMTGRLSNEAVINLYKQEGVMYFCNVSTTEGLPVSIMEAMSFGIPVIATDVGGTSELVDKNNGELIPSNLNKHSLYESLVKHTLIPDAQYNKKRESSRRKWEELVSAESNYKEFCNLIGG